MSDLHLNQLEKSYELLNKKLEKITNKKQKSQVERKLQGIQSQINKLMKDDKLK